MHLRAQLLNMLFPPQCLQCSEQVGVHGSLCPECWSKVNFIADPACMSCGFPFDFNMGAGAQCAECIREQPPFAQGRAVFRYDEHSRQLVLRLKFQDDLALAVTYGPWLKNAAGQMLLGCEVIVPVPLHYFRFLKRRYNQAALLGKALSKASGLPMIPDALMRIRATEQQTGLSEKERKKNVRGAFKANPKQAEHIRAKTVLLVDDVYTTGATLSACAKALLKAGAKEVNVLTLARRV